MPCRFQEYDFLIFGVYGYLLVDICAHWNKYNSCHSPIQLFLLGTFVCILLYRTLVLSKASPLCPQLVRRLISKFIYFVLHPFFVYLTVQGAIWQQLNYEYTPDCIPFEELPLMIWWWIGCLAVLDVLFIYASVTKAIKWWRVRRLQRRIRGMLGELTLVEEQVLFQMLLANNEERNERNNNMMQIGIERGEMQRIASEVFQHDLNVSGASREGIDSCSICCEDFLNGIEVKRLPGCNHLFHPKCIEEWLVINPLCPMCRSNVRLNLIYANAPGVQSENRNGFFNIQDLEYNMQIERISGGPL